MEIDLPEVLSEVTAAFLRYEKALCENDLVTLEELFWPSSSTLRYGPGEQLYGALAIKEFRASRPNVRRPRALLRINVTTFGKDFATANAEYRNEGETRLGRQSQTWVKMGGNWHIVAAHVSFCGD